MFIMIFEMGTDLSFCFWFGAIFCCIKMGLNVLVGDPVVFLLCTGRL